MTFSAQKMKFSIKDFSVNETKSAGNCGFAHNYWKNPGKLHFLCSDSRYCISK